VYGRARTAISGGCIRTALVAGICILLGTCARAQDSESIGNRGNATNNDERGQRPDAAEERDEQTAVADSEAQGTNKTQVRKGAFVAAPLPISSPAIGSGIVPVVAYIFPLSNSDKLSSSSVIAAAGLFTNNNSRGVALGGQFYINKDRFRIETAYVRGNLDYNLYGLGLGSTDRKLPLKHTGSAYFGQFLTCIPWKLFVGPEFFSGSSLITVRLSTESAAPKPPDLGLHTTLRAVGIRLHRETSSNRFYPTDGTYFDFASDFFSQKFGSDYSFNSYKLTFNKYLSLTRKQVLAYKFFGCATGGAPPFYGNCIYGTNNELRGYTAGRYLDRYMVATQLEYRLALPKRLGLVAFGGVGEVIPGGNQLFRNTEFLPALGAGARFELSKQYHVNLRADIAQGKDGHTFSMGVGEAF
jgi:hypothetical protein